MIEVRLERTIPSPWMNLPPIRVGEIPVALGTPDVFALVQMEGKPWRRIDVYAASESCFAFEEAITWSTFIVIGYGNHVYLIDPVSQETVMYPLQGYFGHLYPAESLLLVASASHLLCLDTTGHLKWTTACLGVDGVLVEEIEANYIVGRGEWDPPGGWKPFQVNVHTGQLQDASEHP